MNHVDRVVNSALWAAYGDALGFISEGVDEKGLSRRLDGREFDTFPWVRKVSRFSPDLQLPAGLYSDDTQLRLATSRAIRTDGSFDADYFSTVELPAWLNYHLGAGFGTQSSARRLRAGIAWTALVRGDKDGRYVNGGGNGALMRIQPHVWSSTDEDTYLRDVVINTACTHGHPKAFVGSLFHAICLRETLVHGNLPDIDAALLRINHVEKLSGLLAESPHMGPNWIDQWERSTASNFLGEWLQACGEVRRSLETLPRQTDAFAKRGHYKAWLAKVNLHDPSERGVATKCAVAGYVSVWLHKGMPPKQILQMIAYQVGTDTDTIATLAGAFIGASLDEECRSAILDREYVISEATRVSVAGIGRGAEPSDATRLPKNASVLRGLLSFVSTTSEPMAKRASREAYQWARLPFGQTVLLRVPVTEPKEPSLFDANAPAGPTQTSDASRHDTERRDPVSIARAAAQSGFDAERLGRFILNCARLPHGEGLASSVAYEVVRLYRDRERALTTSAPGEPKAREKMPPYRQELHAALQLQLRAEMVNDELTLSGNLSNYGRQPATDVVVTIGKNRSLHELKVPALDVDNTLEIEEHANSAIEHGTVVVVSFKSDGLPMRQTGRFETAAGNDAILLLKGLDLAKPGIAGRPSA
ncbi:MAG: ADP-ribosylglycohydrolase family protein [Candidatus Aquilonibacter sp.]